MMPDGREVTLDRETSTWSRDDDGDISVTFETPYIWDGEGMDYDGPTILKSIDEALYFSEEIEDDAEAGYELALHVLSFIDSSGILHTLKNYRCERRCA